MFKKQDILLAGAGAFLVASVGASTLSMGQPPANAPAILTQHQKMVSSSSHASPIKTPKWIRRPRLSN